MGKDQTDVKLIEAISEEEIINKKGIKRFVWVHTEKINGVIYARLTGDDREGFMKSIASSDGLAIIPEGVQKFGKGTKTETPGARLDALKGNSFQGRIQRYTG